jgi:hypothetical protein
VQHANPLVRLLVPLFSVIIIGLILTARRRELFIRRIQGLNAIDEAVGRATEMGRPMLCCTGLGDIDIITLQALSIITYIIRASARFGTRAINPVYGPQMMSVTREAIQEAYTQAGRPDQYNPDDIRFLSNRQFAFAASVAGIIWREKVAASFLFGSYFAEAMIFAETGQQVGAIQVAGTPSITQIPFFIAACDYVIIGDEFYAASAYLSREPTALGSLVGQDIIKGFLLALVAFGSLFATVTLAAWTAHPDWYWTFVNWFTK